MKHPTSNIQHRTTNDGHAQSTGCWMLSVGCSMLFLFSIPGCATGQRDYRSHNLTVIGDPFDKTIREYLQHNQPLLPTTTPFDETQKNGKPICRDFKKRATMSSAEISFAPPSEFLNRTDWKHLGTPAGKMHT